MCWQVGAITLGCPGCHTVYSDCDTVTDAFNRADAGDGTLGFADTGQRWTNVAGPFDAGLWTTQGTTVDTAQAQVPMIDHYRAMATLLDAGGNNQDLTATGDCDHDNSIGIFVRCTSDLESGYHVFYTKFSGAGVYKFTNGTGVLLAAHSSLPLNTPFTARVVIKDNLITSYYNSTVLSSVTIDPDDAGGNCETDWTFCGLREDHGGSGGSAPTQITVYTDTHWDDLSVVAP